MSPQDKFVSLFETTHSLAPDVEIVNTSQAEQNQSRARTTGWGGGAMQGPPAYFTFRWPNLYTIPADPANSFCQVKP